MPVSRILVVDDESLMREFITESLISQGYDVDDAEDGTRALELMGNETYDVILTDFKMPKVSGMDVLKRAREKMPDAKVVIMTAYGTVENAVEAMKLGAYDYITKPFSVDEIILLVKRALEYASLQIENRRLHSELEEVYGARSIIGSSPSMKKIFELIETVSQSRSTVLITGESGTGKELIARAIHYMSPRQKGPFIKLNCAALPSELMESELFGHEKGAFTGAVRKYHGRFERSDGGTLLLDEISEMSPHLQAKLLRVLQEREFEPVGSTETIKVDVRILATSNRDISQLIGKGEFREDLYYRLNVINIVLPPLRERKSDIPNLGEHFLRKYNTENGKAVEGISDEVLDVWREYNWPGNVRELENTVERAVVMCKDTTLHVADTQMSNVGDKQFAGISENKHSEQTVTEIAAGKTLADMERNLIMKTLESEGGNRTNTADRLGISVRTLRNKLALYGEMNAFKRP
ncbi:MAG: sigma-54-dependent Fis family transcriptional regulator [Candidatus Latescibacteria bacterium]|nr:sigma-54-dependent Fis family transcriptional regulator [Candidatus Latescibacterota bacterium]